MHKPLAALQVTVLYNTCQWLAERNTTHVPVEPNTLWALHTLAEGQLLTQLWQPLHQTQKTGCDTTPTSGRVAPPEATLWTTL